MTGSHSALNDVVRRVETTRNLDVVAGALAPIAARITRSDRTKALLSGSFLGHPLHPALTDVPIGCWVSASVLDLVGGGGARSGTQRLVALGIVATVPTALTGLTDWQDTSGGARRVGVAHAIANSCALLMQVASWSARRKGHHVRGAALGALGLGALGIGGYLGGHLAFASSENVGGYTEGDAPTLAIPDEAPLPANSGSTSRS